MDGAESRVKKRILPTWMTDDNSGPKKPRATETRKKTHVSSRKRTVYCMNEKELVECALEILSPGKAQRDLEERTKAEEELCPDTDKNPLIPPYPEKPKTIPPLSNNSDDGMRDPDDDPLKYVREIFFS
ncbi:cell cycle regulator of non-homologous end joining [Rhinoderma darwinii]|uniref:cell cycle regulator of non-homologous end joining n=1 Tax=Rhinoderma darwinii TaxID=43563 RepID=UPI003F6617CE